MAQKTKIIEKSGVEPDNADKSQKLTDLSNEISELNFIVFNRKTSQLVEYIVKLDNGFIISIKIIQEAKLLNKIDENLSREFHANLPFYDEKNNCNFSLKDYKCSANPQKTIEEFYNMILKFFINNFDYIRKNAI